MMLGKSVKKSFEGNVRIWDSVEWKAENSAGDSVSKGVLESVTNRIEHSIKWSICEHIKELNNAG